MQTEAWLRVAGLVTWLVCGIPILLERGGSRALPGLPWMVAFVAFGVAFLAQGRPRHPAPLAVQTFAGLAMVALARDGLPGATLVVVAAQLLYALRPAYAVAWMVIQTVLLTGIFWWMSAPVRAIASGGAYFGFQIFAMATSWLALSEGRARQDLARTNAELTATRELLAENSRVAERLRISRDLHDMLGHHLTALSIQLDVASRLTGGAAADHVREAHAITRLLLGDVRDVVSRLRGSSRIDLTDALRALAAGGGPVAIHLDMPERLDLDDAAQAHALLRCVQEIITNAARHGAARNLWVRIEQRADGIDLQARDDGRGAPELKWGNGLKGMRERFEEYAGRVEFQSAAGEGFEVHGFMPRAEAVG